jgi:hypothetical protein
MKDGIVLSVNPFGPRLKQEKVIFALTATAPFIKKKRKHTFLK